MPTAKPLPGSGAGQDKLGQGKGWGITCQPAGFPTAPWNNPILDLYSTKHMKELGEKGWAHCGWATATAWRHHRVHSSWNSHLISSLDPFSSLSFRLEALPSSFNKVTSFFRTAFSSRSFSASHLWQRQETSENTSCRTPGEGKKVPQARATWNVSKTKLQLPCFMYKWCIYILQEFSWSDPWFVQKTPNFYNKL